MDDCGNSILLNPTDDVLMDNAEEQHISVMIKRICRSHA